MKAGHPWQSPSLAPVKEVHDHLCRIDGYSGFYLESAEDHEAVAR
jgi:hypothetical protein